MSVLSVRLIALLIVVVACSNANEKSVPKSPDHDVVVAAAHNDYDYGAPTIPVQAVVPQSEFDNSGVNTHAAPKQLTIAKATLKIGHVGAPDSQVMAMIQSDVAYDALGIPAGVSYVWRNKRDPPKTDRSWKAWLVPELAGLNMPKLKRAKHESEYSHGDFHEPRLVYIVTRDYIAFGMCLDDPICSSGHCGYSAIE